MSSHVIAYRSLELLFGTQTFHFICFFDDFNCIFTQIRCLSRVLYGEMVLDSFNLNRPGMIIFRPIMIIRKVKETLYKSDFGV